MRNWGWLDEKLGVARREIVLWGHCRSPPEQSLTIDDWSDIPRLDHRQVYDITDLCVEKGPLQ